MRVLFYGPQGSGKSTQAQLLAETLNVPMISAGQISRELASKDDPEGKLIKNLIDKGDATPNEIIVREINKRLDNPSSQNGFVMDGYPRFAQQIEYLILAGEERGWEIDKVVVIDLSEEIGHKRVLSWAEIEGRNDDTVESLKRRLELYRQQTQPIISYFETLGKVVHIDGSGTVEEVRNLIKKSIINDKN
ncbi:nucleoside monophosphate kinase [Candidatus Microgenomates bacterium]|nr:nucleoside monophosphate kinase [Candidatus Microgenomates bacterium]